MTEDRIFFIFNFKYLRIASFSFIGGVLISCSSEPGWIRRLPLAGEFQPNIDIILPLGNFIRPSFEKSPMKSKSDISDWSEWLTLKESHTFQKEFRSYQFVNGKTRMEIMIGTGVYQNNGPWVLFVTRRLETTYCEFLKRQIDWKKYNENPCLGSIQKTTSRKFNHQLLYHFDAKNQSLAILQFESGYLEAGFGIGWEVRNPYTEDQFFKKIRDKYTKKEFQPHVYFYGRLDRFR